jgi:hypothetical protein
LGKQHGQGRFTNITGNSRIGVWVCGERVAWLAHDVTGIALTDPESLLEQYKEKLKLRNKTDNTEPAVTRLISDE